MPDLSNWAKFQHQPCAQCFCLVLGLSLLSEYKILMVFPIGVDANKATQLNECAVENFMVLHQTNFVNLVWVVTGLAKIGGDIETHAWAVVGACCNWPIQSYDGGNKWNNFIGVILWTHGITGAPILSCNSYLNNVARKFCLALCSFCAWGEMHTWFFSFSHCTRN